MIEIFLDCPYILNTSISYNGISPLSFLLPEESSPGFNFLYSKERDFITSISVSFPFSIDKVNSLSIRASLPYSYEYLFVSEKIDLPFYIKSSDSTIHRDYNFHYYTNGSKASVMEDFSFPYYKNRSGILSQKVLFSYSQERINLISEIIELPVFQIGNSELFIDLEMPYSYEGIEVFEFEIVENLDIPSSNLLYKNFNENKEWISHYFIDVPANLFGYESTDLIDSESKYTLIMNTSLFSNRLICSGTIDESIESYDENSFEINTPYVRKKGYISFPVIAEKNYPFGVKLFIEDGKIYPYIQGDAESEMGEGTGEGTGTGTGTEPDPDPETPTGTDLRIYGALKYNDYYDSEEGETVYSPMVNKPIYLLDQVGGIAGYATTSIDGSYEFDGSNIYVADTNIFGLYLPFESRLGYQDGPSGPEGYPYSVDSTIGMSNGGIMSLDPTEVSSKDYEINMNLGKVFQYMSVTISGTVYRNTDGTKELGPLSERIIGEEIDIIFRTIKFADNIVTITTDSDGGYMANISTYGFFDVYDSEIIIQPKTKTLSLNDSTLSDNFITGDYGKYKNAEGKVLFGQNLEYSFFNIRVV